ncbi:hypothetical protein J6590_059553 [Homalodisca vitripennis]|nr:hypothetical protein J6590_059553 [Homalodisca vitripennis]
MCLKFIVMVAALVVVGGAVWFFVFRDKTSNKENSNNAPLDLLCNTILSSDLQSEVSGYKSTVNRIVSSVLSGSFRYRVNNELATFVDRFGNRLSGSENLENSIDYMLKLLESYQLDNVHGENVSVPQWNR